MGESDVTSCTCRDGDRAPLAGSPARRALLRLVVLGVLVGLGALVCLSASWIDAASFGRAFARDRDGGGDDSGEMERQRKEMQRAQKEQERQAREQVRQAQEQAKEQQRQAREQARQARDQAQQARQDQRDSTPDNSNNNADDGDSGNDNTASDDNAGQDGIPDDSQGSRRATRNSDDGGNRNNARQKDDSAPSKSRSEAKADGKKGSADGTSDDDDAGSDDANKTDLDDKPPTTMVGVFKKLFGSPQSPSEKSANRDAQKDHSSGLGKGGNGAANPANTAANGKNPPPAAKIATNGKDAPKVTPKAKSGGKPEPINLDIVRHNEVLAVNVSKKTLASAVAKGFKSAEQSTLSSLSVSVTRLIAPSGMSTEQANLALATIAASETGGSFAANQHYRIYKTATGNSGDAQANQGSAQAGGPPCSGDHCYGRDVMGWDGALKTCAKAINVGIIDTSVDTAHPAFKNKSIEVSHQQATKAGKSPDWHGTGVLAILAGDDSSQTPGLIPDANFYVADAFFADDDGEPATDTMSLLRAMDWLKKKNVKLINMSLSGPADELIHSAINKMAETGVIFVAAAGNDGSHGAPSYPAAYPQVIAVTAINKNLSSYVHATQGSYVDLAAPGVAIWTAMPGARQGYHSGTSFAAPYVTAAVASLYRRLSEKSKPGVLQQVSYKDLGEPGRDPVYGNGLLLAPPACGTSSVASSSGGAIAVPAVAAPAQKPVGFGFQSSSMTSGAGLEALPWLSGGR